jgi:hypothetical protein
MNQEPMTNRRKQLPYYVFLIGILLLSIGFNLVQYEEIKELREEKESYKTFFEYIYIKYLDLQIEILEQKPNKTLT